jgi:D-aspartate ligase
MITNLFILGNHIQALGLARQAKKIGLTVHLFNKDWASVARFSNACKYFHIFKDEQDLLKQLTSASSNIKNTLLIATNDSLINFVSVNNNELSRLYYLSVPDPSVIDICYNKRKTYQKAMELGIPIPLSFFPDSLSDIEKLADKISYPTVIKPAIMHTFHKMTGKKVFFCKTKEELISYYKQIITIIPANEVIVQEFLSGGAKSLYSFGSFYAKGTVYGSFSANRIRQNPMDFGNSTTYAITVYNPDFESIATKFLESIDYFGLSEVEFMEDPATGQYKMLEINPRAWKWHSIANKLNINLLEMMVNYLNQKPVEINNDHQTGVAWIERITDTTVVLKEIMKGKMKFSEYRASLKLKKESAVCNWNDPLPAIMYLILTPYLFIKRK